MEDYEKIKTILLKTNPQGLSELKKELSLFPDIQLVGCSECIQDSKKMLLQINPDLVLFDIELEGKNGLFFLNELKKEGQLSFEIIILTPNDKSILNTFKEQEMNYLLKPINFLALKEAIERYKALRKPISVSKPSSLLLNAKIGDTIALPSATGLQFIYKRNIVMVQSSKECSCDRKCWEVILHDSNLIKLKKETSLRDIHELLGIENFVQINQSCLLNIHFLGAIEFKTRECVLQPPFSHLKLTISRHQMSELRNRFDIL